MFGMEIGFSSILPIFVWVS